MEIVEVSTGEEVLVQRAIAGDRDAFGELYERFLDPIYRYIFYRLGDTHDTEDLTEQVFLKAWQALPSYQDGGSSISCWLYRIAHNLIVDYHRSHRKNMSPSLDEPLEELQSEVNILKQVIEAEEASTLAKAVARLNEEQQQVILLRFVEGLSHAEIARIMNKSEGACRMLQNRALTALHWLLGSMQGSKR